MLLALPAEAVEGVAVPVAGEPFLADFAAVAPDGQIAFTADGKTRTLPLADLVRWGECPELGRGCFLVLADGGVLAADVAAADKENLTLDSEALGTRKLPLEFLAGVVFEPPVDREERDELIDRLARDDVRSDRLLLDNGDEISGTLDGIAADTIRFRTDVGPLNLKTDRVTAIIFNPALRRRPAASANAPRAWAGFSDGSRLLAARLSSKGKSLDVLSAVGQRFTAAGRDLVFLQPLGGRATYLADMKPTECRQTPFLDLAWPCRADRNVAGGMLRSGGRLFLKGLGVHSAARLVYALPPPRTPGDDHRRFEALVGVDDATEGGGSVVFRVLVDGEERFTSKTIRGGDPPVPVSLGLAGARKLELVVDYADRADVLDRADWLDARLVD